MPESEQPIDDSLNSFQSSRSNTLLLADIHEDLRGSCTQTQIIYAWLIFALAIVFGMAKGGVSMAILSLLLVSPVPLLAHFSYAGNIKECKRLTAALKTTEPLTGKLKVFTNDPHITRASSPVTFVDVDVAGKIFKCAVISSSHKHSFAEGEYTAPVHCSPETGRPALALVDGARMWLEQRPF
ncbi:hypothetical protein BH10CYA1_BH10CYA1_51630 [soil metagenome]